MEKSRVKQEEQTPGAYHTQLSIVSKTKASNSAPMFLHPPPYTPEKADVEGNKAEMKGRPQTRFPRLSVTPVFPKLLPKPERAPAKKGKKVSEGQVMLASMGTTLQKCKCRNRPGTEC